MGAGDQGFRLHRQRRGPDPQHRLDLDRLAGKYAPLVPVLRELVARPDTPLSDEAKAAYCPPAGPGRRAVLGDPVFRRALNTRPSPPASVATLINVFTVTREAQPGHL